MGILALKAMARQKWPTNACREDHPACWYQPEDRPDVASLGLRFAWSRGATACVPPGDVALWKLSLQLAATSPLSSEEESRLAGMAKELAPIFPQ